MSVSKLINNGNSIDFNQSHCYIRNKNNILVATAELTNGVYKLITKEADCRLAAPSIANAELWHRRLAHINCCDLNKMKNAINMTKNKCVTTVNTYRCMWCYGD